MMLRPFRLPARLFFTRRRVRGNVIFARPGDLPSGPEATTLSGKEEAP